MSKKIKAIITALSAVILIAAIAQISAAVNLNNIKKLTLEKSFEPQTVTANDECNIKSQPLSLSPSKKKVKAGDELKIVAQGKNWSKVIYYTDKAVKTGYLKSGCFEITSSADENESNNEQPNTPISFASQSYSVDEYETLDLSKELEADSADLKWFSSNEKAVSVNNGIVEAKDEGASIIYAYANGKSAECAVNVRAINGHAEKELNIINAYGNKKNYHPSVLYFKDGWNGYKYWLAHTPYENCNDYWENPHISVSNDLKNWTEPKGFSNPLEPVPENYEHGIIYNSDTELVFNDDTQFLECWWRFYNRTDSKVCLKRKTTADGVHWSAEEDMLVLKMGQEDALSPALLYEDGIYKMWAVNFKKGYTVEYRESKNGKDWGEARALDIQFENPIYSSWHLDVIHTPKGYEMSLSANLTGTNNRTVMPLFYSFSPDNITWTKARTLLAPQTDTGNWDNKGIYRSCLLYADDKYYLFYSGINTKTGPVGIGMISGNNVFHMN